MIKQLKTKINSDKNFKDVLKGTSLAAIAKIVSVVFTFMTSLITARYYGAEVLGTLAIIGSVLAIFSVFALMGMNTAVLRLIPEYLQKYSVSSAYAVYQKSLSIVLGLSLLSAIVLYGISPLLAESVFHKAYLEFFLSLAALFIVTQAVLAYNREAIRGLQNIKVYAIMQFLPSVLTFLLIAVVTFFFYNKYNPVYVMFAVSFLISSITLILMRYLFKLTSNENEEKYVPSRSELMTLSFPMFLTTTMNTVIGQSDILILGVMRSESEVGIYAIAFMFAMVTSLLLGLINSIAAPRFSQLYYSGKMDELKSVAQKSTKLIFWSSLPIMLTYLIFGVYILDFYGEEFTAGYYALVFLSIGQFVNALVGSVGNFLNMTGHQKDFRNIVTFGALLNIVLNLILIPNYGINGAAFGTMISISLLNIIAAITIKRKFGYSITYIPFLTTRKQNV